ncbi:Uma2 family endonuclease [Alienimonas sp. DA493]|uniref:Uma2 family endonuclease n=1 Tax=Alienimonas sp. DA493 TaxID=3373605 RepID=UPI0037549DB2
MTAALADPPTRRPEPQAQPAAAVPAPPAPDVHLPGVGVDGDGLTVPGAALASFRAFRAWKLSDACPEWGKFEWIGGRPRLEVMPESLFTHGSPKLRIAATLDRLVEERDLGYCFTDSTTVVSPEGFEPEVNCEPDVVFLSHEAIAEGRVTLTPKAGREGDFTEIVGPPDAVVEVRSDSSTRKDTVDLPADLFALGVSEYWLADARVEPPVLTIHTRGEGRFEPVAADADGFVRSAVFGRRYRLETCDGRSGLRQTRLVEAPAE